MQDASCISHETRGPSQTVQLQEFFLSPHPSCHGHLSWSHFPSPSLASCSFPKRTSKSFHFSYIERFSLTPNSDPGTADPMHYSLKHEVIPEPPAPLCLGGPSRLDFFFFFELIVCSLHRSNHQYVPFRQGPCSPHNKLVNAFPFTLDVRKENWKTALTWIISEWRNCERCVFSSFCLSVLSERSIIGTSI